MFKKIATAVSALVLATTLASCSPGEERNKVDVNGLTVSEACDKVREAGWRVHEVRFSDYSDGGSDCSDSEQKVVRADYATEVVTLFIENQQHESETPIEEVPAEDPIVEEETPIEEAAIQETPVEETASIDSNSGYQAIYDEYSARLQNECPVLSVIECAELSNEGISKMAEYMYTAKGTDGQYATYETWGQKLTDVYLASAQ